MLFQPMSHLHSGHLSVAAIALIVALSPARAETAAVTLPDAATNRAPNPATMTVPPTEMQSDHARRLEEWERRLAERERQFAERQAAQARWRAMPPEARRQAARQAELEARYADLRRRAAENGLSLPENPPWQRIAGDAAETAPETVPSSAIDNENGGAPPTLPMGDADGDSDPMLGRITPEQRAACMHAHRRLLPAPTMQPPAGGWGSYYGPDAGYGPGYGTSGYPW